MSILKKYIFLNVLFIVFHVMMFFGGIMGFGSAPDYTPKIELLKGLLFFAFIGASPNLVILVLALIRGKQIRENMKWSLLFFALVFSIYVAVFWSVLE
ncbi:hypothetical protein [Bacillus pinisoli]|uniref:hypothetical protein n=1 Tax=Bacillus pinisoli TaxID=2901866 RepID=UPI001FF126B9|nr:hypothetical protein [Bacillus pinisoli]